MQFSKLLPGELSLEPDKLSKFNSIDAKVRLAPTPVGISAHFEVNFVCQLCCVRCLAGFVKEFNEQIHFYYIQGKDPYLAVEKVELQREDVDKIYYKGPFIDVSIGIREAIILAVPIAPLCKVECQGLCQFCGKNLNKGKCQCQKEANHRFTLKSPRIS